MSAAPPGLGGGRVMPKKDKKAKAGGGKGGSKPPPAAAAASGGGAAAVTPAAAKEAKEAQAWAAKQWEMGRGASPLAAGALPTVAWPNSARIPLPPDFENDQGRASRDTPRNYTLTSATSAP